MSDRQYPDPAAMYELLRDLCGAQAAAHTVPSPGVMQVIAAARQMIDANEHGATRRDAEGHDKVCKAAAVALASPRLDGMNAATARSELTNYARAGYDGNANPHLSTSPAWYAHALGRYLHDTGRSVPVAVRMGRGDSIRSGDMRFTFKTAGGRIQFERVL